MMHLSLKAKGLILVVLTSLCWGSNFLFIKVVVAEIPPITLVFLRVAIGTAAICLIALFRKINLWEWKHYWKTFAIMALTMNVIPFTLISWGERYISSALAGILNSLAVISVAVIAHYFGPHDPLTKNRIAGIFSGVFGLVVIYFPILLHEPYGNSLGTFMMVLACLSYGVGAVYVRTHLRQVPSMTALTAQMLCATIILLPLSLFIDRPFSLPFPSSEVILSMIMLGVIGTGIGLIFYYKAIQMAGATYATLAVLLSALFAMLCGSIFLHEQITWNMYLGAFLILAGLLAVNPVFDKSVKN